MPVIQAEIPTREYAVSFSYKYSSEPAGFLAHSWMIFRINSEDLLLTSGVRGERQPSAVTPRVPPVWCHTGLDTSFCKNWPVAHVRILRCPRGITQNSVAFHGSVAAFDWSRKVASSKVIKIGLETSSWVRRHSPKEALPKCIDPNPALQNLLIQILCTWEGRRKYSLQFVI